MTAGEKVGYTVIFIGFPISAGLILTITLETLSGLGRYLEISSFNPNFLQFFLIISAIAFIIFFLLAHSCVVTQKKTNSSGNYSTVSKS